MSRGVFFTALEICDKLFNTSVGIFSSTSQNKLALLRENEEQFLDSLQEQYSIPDDRDATARKLGFCEKIVRNIHKKLKEKGLMEPTGTAKRWRKVKTALT